MRKVALVLLIAFVLLYGIGSLGSILVYEDFPLEFFGLKYLAVNSFLFLTFSIALYSLIFRFTKHSGFPSLLIALIILISFGANIVSLCTFLYTIINLSG